MMMPRVLLAGTCIAVLAVGSTMTMGQRRVASGRESLEQGKVESEGDDSDSRVQQGFQIAPVPLNLDGKNRGMVGLGSYLVNAIGGCNDCHTNPSYAVGGNPFLGQPTQVNAANYLAGGQHFGPFTSRNITPDPTTGLPAGLTFDQFLHVIQTGVDPDQEHPQISPLLQVMPWPTFRNMHTRDLRAIYEYLRAIPHAEPGGPAPTAAPAR
jgi:hypothetical protein